MGFVQLCEKNYEPGKYFIAKDTFGTSRISKNSRKTRQYDVNDVVIITCVQEVPDEHRIRGRLDTGKINFKKTEQTNFLFFFLSMFWLSKTIFFQNC